MSAAVAARGCGSLLTAKTSQASLPLLKPLTATAHATAQGSRSLLNPRSPLLAPLVLAAVVAYRYVDAIHKRCTDASKSVFMNSTAHVPSSSSSPAIACDSHFPAKPLLSSHSSYGPHKEQHSWSSIGTPISQHCTASTSLFGRGQDGLSNMIPVLPRQRRSIMPVKAIKDVPYSFRSPEMTKKPEWWWRTLACVPYLMALQFSDIPFYLEYFLEHHDNFLYFLPGAIKRLPSWFVMVYCYIAYVKVVKNKEWPHFFRFHVMMGILLEMLLQVVWHACNLMPLVHYYGKFGMHFWTAVAFVYIFLLLECVRRALGGKYVNIPLISDAAHMHMHFRFM